MVTYFLALALVFDMETKKPDIQAPFKTREACELAAMEANNKVSKAGKKKGLGYVCLKVEWPGSV